MKRYTSVSDESLTETDASSVRRDCDSISIASSRRRFRDKHSINSELSEPLTSESLGGGDGDPYFVFRSDLKKKLDSLDEQLAEYLRIVHETVRVIVRKKADCLAGFRYIACLHGSLGWVSLL